MRLWQLSLAIRQRPNSFQALSEAEVPFVDGLDSFVDAQQAYRETQAEVARTTQEREQTQAQLTDIQTALESLQEQSTKLPSPNKPQSLLGAILQRQNSLTY